MPIERIENGHYVVYFTRYGIHLRQNSDLDTRLIETRFNRKLYSNFSSIIRSTVFRLIGVVIFGFCSWIWLPSIFSVSILSFAFPFFLTQVIILVRDNAKQSVNIPWELITKITKTGSVIQIYYLGKQNVEIDVELKDITDDDLSTFVKYCNTFNVNVIHRELMSDLNKFK